MVYYCTWVLCWCLIVWCAAKRRKIFQKEAYCKGVQNSPVLFCHENKKPWDNEIQIKGGFGLQLTFIWSVLCGVIHCWEQPVKCTTYNMWRYTLPTGAVWFQLTSERQSVGCSPKAFVCIFWKVMFFGPDNLYDKKKMKTLNMCPK